MRALKAHRHTVMKCKHGIVLGQCKCIGNGEEEQVEIVECEPPCPHAREEADSG